MKKQGIRFLLLILLLVTLSACQQAIEIEGEERDALVAAADPIADSILTGMTAGDYATFSQHFDQAMLSGMPETSFNDMRSQFQEKLGDYQSREVAGAQAVDQYDAVIYTLTFTKAPAVTMRLVLSRDDPPKATGLWFDAPELRAQ